MAQLVHELIDDSAWQTQAGLGLRYADDDFDYQTLARAVAHTDDALLALDLERQDRTAVFMEQRGETALAELRATLPRAASQVDRRLLARELAILFEDAAA